MSLLALLAFVVTSQRVSTQPAPPRHCNAEALDCAEACADQCVGEDCLVPCAWACRRQDDRCHRSVRRQRSHRIRERRRRVAHPLQCAELPR
jgi:hypothetical protein